MNWHARMISPYGKTGSGLGHYDLQLVGNHTIDGITYANPVFSYNRESRTGFLSIFNGSMSAMVYQEALPFRIFNCSGESSSTDAQYHAFLKLIMDSIDLSSKRAVEVTDTYGEKIRTYYRYSITSSYREYDKATHNCFKAVGRWMNALGDSRFADFAETHAYTDYTASAFMQNYPSLWDLTDTCA